MSENCSHNCGSCGADCSSRQTNPADFIEPLNSMSSVKKVIGVVSGKGGVGKSMVTASLAVLMNRKGYHSAVLDADITGPSIPKVFGMTEKAEAHDFGLLPVKSEKGIDVMSINLLLENDSAPVVWRGPVIAGTVKQFWGDTVWEDVDFMFVDMPPGTGDVPLTVFQSIPLDGIIIVTSPQELVSMIVAKAANMAKLMNIPILGIIENYSYLKCPDCGKKISVFGESHIDEIAEEFEMEVLAKLPIDPAVAQLCDAGRIEETDGSLLENTADKIEALLAKEEQKSVKTVRRIAVTAEGSEIFQHFGKCQSFALFDVKGDEILSKDQLNAEENGHSALAGMLHDHQVDVLICGGIGQGAKDALASFGIELVAGASGNIASAVKSYLRGTLKHNADFTCAHHEHGGESCGHTCQNHCE